MLISEPHQLERQLATPARAFLEQLIQLQLIAPDSADAFLQQIAPQFASYDSPQPLGEALVEAGLLTTYQLDRVKAGTTHGLVLGNHRILSRLGSGAMAVVFLAEHMLMKRRVAVKVMPVDDDCPAVLLDRFYAEMRVLAELHHANIVLAFDAGHVPGAGPRMPHLLYLVMELVTQGDLEQYVIDHGPVEIAQACDWIRQAACGLQEAHDHHLIHRDIKPSNLLLSARGQIKVVDFGLAKQFCSRLTNSLALLGTVEYMAPEQSCDPTLVDAPADIYGLGASLFWLLTGETPYPPARSVAEALRLLQNGQPRRLRSLRPDAPQELDELVGRMLDRDPTRRPPRPLTVMNALLPFSSRLTSAVDQLTAVPGPEPAATGDGLPQQTESKNKLPAASGYLKGKRLLLVDDEPPIRILARGILEPLGCICDEAEDVTQALAAIHKQPYDLLLLDVNLPDGDGYALCRQLREQPVQPNLKIIIVSGRGDHNELAESLPLGADDYIPKPFGVRQLAARVQHAIRLKEAQDQADFFARQLALTNQQLDNSLTARTGDVRRAQDALLFAMAKMAESREGETPGHLRRLQRYTRSLAEHATKLPNWAGTVNGTFLEQLERCVPLHDIGKIGLPEHILAKAGKLMDTERSLMETHTIIGDRILEALGAEHGESLGFLGMASAIVRHHHERFNGKGYPDRLAGEAIPPAARLVALADVYDALRRQRFYKPALSHADASRILLQESPGQFDPDLLQAFTVCDRDFERIYRDIPT